MNSSIEFHLQVIFGDRVPADICKIMPLAVHLAEDYEAQSRSASAKTFMIDGGDDFIELTRLLLQSMGRGRTIKVTVQEVA
jgi:hypothetical protein